jgi:hypothetical protein
MQNSEFGDQTKFFQIVPNWAESEIFPDFGTTLVSYLVDTRKDAADIKLNDQYQNIQYHQECT